MKKRIMKRQLLAVAMAMALVVPQGVYAVEELHQPTEQMEEQPTEISGDVEEPRIHEEGCSLPLDHEGDCASNLEESVKDIEEKSEEPTLIEYECEQDIVPEFMKSTGSGLSEDDPMEVPTERLVIDNGVYYGISKTWFAENNPEKKTLYFSIVIPKSVTKIANDGFRSNYTGDKSKYGAVTTNDKLGDYKIVSIDFSDATELTTIGYQAAKYEPLQGVLDLSETKITRIEQNAFGDCTGLTGVILPNTLETLGTQGGSGVGGSVFARCSGLEFIRTKDSKDGTVFELPEGLKFIGGQTFQDAFAPEANVVAYLPASVETVGSQAFYSSFSQIFIERSSAQGYSNYNESAFKTRNSYNCLLIFPDNVGYNSTDSFTRVTKTYPVVLQFQDSVEQTKLYKQSIQYEYDKESKKWVKNPNYTLPEVSGVVNQPGYDAGWKIYGDDKILTNTSTVNGWSDAVLPVKPESNSVVSKPTVQFRQEDQIIANNGTVPTLLAEVEDGQPAYVGVEVTHPLATEEAKATGTYVYYKYCWWDEYENDVNGPRSAEEPELFSTANSSTSFDRKFTDKAMIPMYKGEHTRMDTDYYLVEIYGYYVNNGKTTLYYKSGHNFIAGDNATDRSYLMHVDVKEKEKFTITPVDMTIYMGGDDGYEGVVGNDGNLVEEETSYNTLPEPLFQIMSASAGFDPESLTITNEKTHNSWNPEKVGDTEYYRLVPTAGEKKLIRVQFIDDNKNVHESDTFDPATVGDLFATYDIKIFSQGDKISVKDEDGKEYAVSTAAGKLTVRAVAENKPNDDPTIDVIDENNLTKVEAGKAVAVASEGTKYYLNNTDVEVTDAKPSLLFDSIIEDEGSTDRTKALMVKADETLGVSAGKRIYEIKYLDLVDANNGNAWIKADKPVTIYWGYPEGTDQNTEFQIVHFRDLHRDGAQSGQELEDIKNCTAEKITGVENTPEGIKFSVGKDGFSPFALIFNEKDEGGNQGGSSSGGSLTSNTYYVRYHNDDDIVKDGRFVPGETVTVRGDIFTAPRGKVLAGWSLEENGKVDYKVGDTFRMPGSSYDLYAVWKNAETLTHAAYISGYPDGTVGPDRTITRAEAATMFYNLLSDKSGTARTFADVPMNQWYANAVTTLAGMGVINGYPDGTFKPDAPITRAEFVTVAMNFAKADKGTACSFVDVPENMWYYSAIAGATENGWISGYPDGTFGPDRYITRAEVTSVINRMENRAADMMFIVENLNDLRTFSDLPFQHWAYGSMMEAANGHDYTREQENTYEVWTGIK